MMCGFICKDCANGIHSPCKARNRNRKPSETDCDCQHRKA